VHSDHVRRYHRQLYFWYPLQSTTTILSNLMHPHQHPLHLAFLFFNCSQACNKPTHPRHSIQRQSRDCLSLAIPWTSLMSRHLKSLPRSWRSSPRNNLSRGQAHRLGTSRASHCTFLMVTQQLYSSKNDYHPFGRQRENHSALQNWKPRR
jgi:hypothetical protein